MIDQAPGERLLRHASAHLGVVARVDAVTRPAQSPAVDPARGTDPRWLELPRPDPESIPIADITQFQGLVYGAEQRVALGASAAGGVGVGPVAHNPLTPADRIVDTLRHLRGLHGL
jgi:hypothetical protein